MYGFRRAPKVNEWVRVSAMQRLNNLTHTHTHKRNEDPIVVFVLEANIAGTKTYKKTHINILFTNLYTK